MQGIAQPAVRNPDAQLAAAGIDTSFIHVDKNNVAPRLGFSFAPDVKTVIRGGYGLFYGRTPSIMIGTAHSGNAINVQTITFTGALSTMRARLGPIRASRTLFWSKWRHFDRSDCVSDQTAQSSRPEM